MPTDDVELIRHVSPCCTQARPHIHLQEHRDGRIDLRLGGLEWRGSNIWAVLAALEAYLDEPRG